MREGSFLALGPQAFHRVAYSDWGAPDNPEIVVCVHGLTRNGRDFDRLAALLSSDYRVVCPDMVGRGRSDWLPAADQYGYPLYCAHMAALLAHLGVERVRWVGTSMGGLIGMLLASMDGSPITRLVMNDVGPVIPKAAIERLRGYVGTDPRFSTLAELERFLRETYASFGDLGEDGWRAFTASSARPVDGGFGLAYDPAIGEALRAAPLEDAVLWPAWERVRCPVQVLHGVDSDILLEETCERMAQRLGTEVRHLASVGHAPSLMVEEQLTMVRDFLAGG